MVKYLPGLLKKRKNPKKGPWFSFKMLQFHCYLSLSVLDFWESLNKRSHSWEQLTKYSSWTSSVIGYCKIDDIMISAKCHHSSFSLGCFWRLIYSWFMLPPEQAPDAFSASERHFSSGWEWQFGKSAVWHQSVQTAHLPPQLLVNREVWRTGGVSDTLSSSNTYISVLSCSESISLTAFPIERWKHSFFFLNQIACTSSSFYCNYYIDQVAEY